MSDQNSGDIPNAKPAPPAGEQEHKPDLIVDWDNVDRSQANELKIYFNVDRFATMNLGAQLVWGIMDEIKKQLMHAIDLKKKRAVQKGAKIIVPGILQ